MKTISRDELKDAIEQGKPMKLIETLAATAFHHAHLPGAINIPPDQVKDLAPKLLPDKTSEVIVYCASPT